MELNLPAGAGGHAVIGDELRIPAVWCDFGACIDRYSHPDALGLADVRARAVAAGWRQDALGRFACPRCVQGNAAFRATMPLAPSQSEPSDELAPSPEELAPLPEEPLAVSAWDSFPLPALRLSAPPAEADQRRFRMREAGRHRLTA